MLRAETGIAMLDRLLEGGLPSIPDIIISGLEEDIRPFSQRILWHRLNAGDKGFYGTISRTREEVHNDFISQGRDVSSFLETNALRLVDFLYLGGAEPLTPEESWNALLSINEEIYASQFLQIFSKALQEAQRTHPRQNFLAIFESIERLVALIGLSNTLQLKQTVRNLIEDTNSIIISLLCIDVLNDTLYDTLKAETPLFIELIREPKGNKSQRMIRVTTSPHDMVCNDWTPYL
jgi:archaellum biogenesis ATPase FlaH